VKDIRLRQTVRPLVNDVVVDATLRAAMRRSAGPATREQPAGNVLTGWRLPFAQVNRFGQGHRPILRESWSPDHQPNDLLSRAGPGQNREAPAAFHGTASNEILDSFSFVFRRAKPSMIT
jgi:hypothetical protein